MIHHTPSQTHIHPITQQKRMLYSYCYRRRLLLEREEWSDYESSSYWRWRKYYSWVMPNAPIGLGCYCFLGDGGELETGLARLRDRRMFLKCYGFCLVHQPRKMLLCSSVISLILMGGGGYLRFSFSLLIGLVYLLMLGFIFQGRIMAVTRFDRIIQNYQLLSHQDPVVRQNANIFLLGLIDEPDVWQISKEMIVQSTDPRYQLLGSQVLAQKIERDSPDLTSEELHSLREFTFQQLGNSQFSLPTLRKLATSGSVVALSLMLDHWQTFLPDLMAFMTPSMHTLKAGLLVMGCIAEQLKSNNRIRHNIKVQCKNHLLDQGALMNNIFESAMAYKDSTVKELTIESLENWVKIGFPLLKSTQIVGQALSLIGQDQQTFLFNVCKLLVSGLEAGAREKFQTLSIIDFEEELKSYDSQERNSISLLVGHLRSNKADLLAAISHNRDTESIQTYSSIIKQLLLSFSFIMLDPAGLQLLEIIMAAIQSSSLKLSYSTFTFWSDFIQKMGKTKLNPQLQARVWKMIDLLLTTLLRKSALENESMLTDLVKDEDTLDDLDSISFAEYRKEGQAVVKIVYDFYTSQRQAEGSRMFFTGMIKVMEEFKTRGALLIGVQLTIWAVRGILESLLKDYDSENLRQYLGVVMQIVGNGPTLHRVAAQLMHLIQNCNRQIRENDTLFLKCLAFSLSHIQQQSLCHYALYAFQALVETIESLHNQQLVMQLLQFYGKQQFSNQNVAQKVLNGILTLLTKLTDRNALGEYMNRVMQQLMSRNTALLQNPNPTITQYYLLLSQTKIFLDSFEQFQEQDKQLFRLTFLAIGTQGITLLNNYIQMVVNQSMSFSNVRELGTCLVLSKNVLSLTHSLPIDSIPMSQFIVLANTVLGVLNQKVFQKYQSLLEVVCQLLTQFNDRRNAPLEQWLAGVIPGINTFFFSYAHQWKDKVKEMDPDMMKWFFAIQGSLLNYSWEVYASQKEQQDILGLVLFSLGNLHERNMQKKGIYLLYQITEHQQLYSHRLEQVLKAVFASIPFLNNLCYLNLGRILVTLLANLDSRKKEAVIRQLLEYAPYQDVSNDLKELFARFLTFAVDSKHDRYLKGVFNDLYSVKWKSVGTDFALHLEMRFTNWKREFARNRKQMQEKK